MASEESLNEEQESSQHAEVEGERERSTIGFPYGDLDDAVEIAKAVHGEFGSGCDWDQLAAKLGQAASGGGFRQRALTAKSFGLITYGQGRVSLTPLGSKICDPKQEKSARAEAFLNVELYRAVYDKFKGGVIPQGKGLESEMASLGVAKKQSDKARQVFQRSATQAGFFWSGQDRLVVPAKVNGEGSAIETQKDPKKDSQQGGVGNDGGSGECDPAIKGLIKRLPAPDSDWSLEKQVKWLLAVSHAFDVIYPREDDGRSLKIEIIKD
jgi:hypothetical protein